MSWELSGLTTGLHRLVTGTNIRSIDGLWTVVNTLGCWGMCPLLLRPRSLSCVQAASLCLSSCTLFPATHPGALSLIGVATRNNNKISIDAVLESLAPGHAKASLVQRTGLENPFRCNLSFLTSNEPLIP